MDVLLFGSDYFKPWLIKAGVRVRHLGPGDGSEIKADPNRVDLASLVSGLEDKPDLLLLTDDLGARVLPFGLERVSLPKVYYGVDSPINYYWQRYLAGVFDLVLLDQRDQAGQLSAELNREVHWLPVGVDTLPYAGPPQERVHDFAFVGTVEHSVRPKRSAILNLLSRKYTVKMAGGRGLGWVSPRDASRLYRSSRLVLNENLFPGLTTRMLEVMASGGCLFSEDVDNGLRDLFCPGVHYIAYDHTNILDLADRYLGDSAAREAIAQKGREACRAGHTIQARTNRLLALCQDLEPGTVQPDPCSLAWCFLLLGLRWPGPESRRRIIKAGLMFRDHLRRVPGSARAVLGFAQALVADNKPVEALKVLEESDNIDDSDYGLPLARAFLLHQLRRGKEAGPWFAQAARAAGFNQGQAQGGPVPSLVPGTYEFHNQWGMILDRAGNGIWPGFNRFKLPMMFWGGVEHLHRAVQLEPERTEALKALARIMDREGQYTFSGMLWKRALDLEPDNRAVRKAYQNAAEKGFIRP